MNIVSFLINLIMGIISAILAIIHLIDFSKFPLLITDSSILEFMGFVVSSIIAIVAGVFSYQKKISGMVLSFLSFLICISFVKIGMSETGNLIFSILGGAYFISSLCGLFSFNNSGKDNSFLFTDTYILNSDKYEVNDLNVMLREHFREYYKDSKIIFNDTGMRIQGYQKKWRYRTYLMADIEIIITEGKVRYKVKSSVHAGFLPLVIGVIDVIAIGFGIEGFILLAILFISDIAVYKRNIHKPTEQIKKILGKMKFETEL